MMRATKGGQKGVREAGAQRRKTVMRRRMAERIQENPGFGGWSPVGITIVRTRQMASSGKGHSEGGGAWRNDKISTDNLGSLSVLTKKYFIKRP